MEKEFANYDLFDRVIANEKKARSWTVFWITLLCLMATAIIGLALNIANEKKKNAILKAQIAAYDSSKARERNVYDSAIAKCAKEKEQLIDTFQTALNKLSTAGNEQNSINRIKGELVQIKTDVKKVKPRVFIQYNTTDINKEISYLSFTLKEKNEYNVAPAELLDMYYNTSIKVYNMDDKDQVNRIRSLISRIFRIPADKIPVQPSSDKTVNKPTIEVWLNGRKFSKAEQLMIK
jgi:hypothetical protein